MVDMAGSGGMVVGVPAHAVRVGQPAAEGAELAVGFRPKNEMPMVGHQGEGEDPQGAFLEGFGQHAEKGGVVSGFFEQGQARDGAIEDMVNETARCVSSNAGHARSVARWPGSVNEKRAASSFLFFLFFSFSTR